MATPRRLLVLLLAALALGGLAACGSDDGGGASGGGGASNASSDGGDPMPIPFARLEANANRLIDASPEEFDKQIAALKGHPIVVNQWASWCGPCRFEFPFFAKSAEKYKGRVAFLGVDSQDSRGEAEAFLEELPIPYPSFFDPDTKIARTFRGGRAFPTTAFYDAAGKLVETHAGTYASQAKLEEDIRKYALG
jgi:thiol-disulfide isomerase/thioredoxin